MILYAWLCGIGKKGGFWSQEILQRNLREVKLVVFGVKKSLTIMG